MRRSKRRRAGPLAAATTWTLQLHQELVGLGEYTYRRLSVERRGRRSAVRQFELRLMFDHRLKLLTHPRRMVRQRGRSLTPLEVEALWLQVAEHHPFDLPDALPCPDHVDAALLDPALGLDGRPIAVTTGEEGPACLTIAAGRGSEQRIKRVLIERYREPGPEWTDPPLAAQAPVSAICAAIEPGLRTVRPFNYRRNRPLIDLMAEFGTLKALDFLNLVEFERRALQAMGAQGDPTAIPLITEELFAADPKVRLRALDALAVVGDPAVLLDVELLYYDEAPEVRDRARQVLELLRTSYA
jgi:HEAT repeats